MELELREDERGYFARTFAADAFRERGLCSVFPQCSVSYNHRAGTLRGLHWQAEPHAEAKLVRCTRGRIFDVIVDLRPDEPTYGRWFATELAAATGLQLYVPEGCAHGFQTLEDGSEVSYQISVPYAPEAARGCHHASPALGIAWPRPVRVISDRDRELPAFER